MESKLVTLAEFGNAEEANIARSTLAAHDIQAVVVGAESATTMSYFGSAVNRVKVQVRDEDHKVAEKLLGLVKSGTHDLADWVCHQCGEDVDSGFEVCWSCGAVFDPTQVRRRKPVDDAGDQTLAGDDDAGRAWRSSVLSIVFPPLVLYTLYLLLKCASLPMSPRGSRQFYGALIMVVLIGCVISGMVGYLGPFPW